MPTTTRRRWPGASSCRGLLNASLQLIAPERACDRGVVRGLCALLAVCLAVGWRSRPCGPDASGAGAAASAPSPAVVEAEPSGQSATLTFFNRPIVVLRARVLGRGPAERADGARRALDDLVARGITGPVESQPFDGGCADHRRLPGRPGADAAGRRRAVRRNRRSRRRANGRAPAAGARRSGRSPHAGRAASLGRCPPRRCSRWACCCCGASARARRAVGRQARGHRRADGRPIRDRRCRRAPRLAAARRGARARDGGGRSAWISS